MVDEGFQLVYIECARVYDQAWFNGDVNSVTARLTERVGMIIERFYGAKDEHLEQDILEMAHRAILLPR